MERYTSFYISSCVCGDEASYSSYILRIRRNRGGRGGRYDYYTLAACKSWRPASLSSAADRRRSYILPKLPPIQCPTAAAAADVSVRWAANVYIKCVRAWASVCVCVWRTCVYVCVCTQISNFLRSWLGCIPRE